MIFTAIKLLDVNGIESLTDQGKKKLLDLACGVDRIILLFLADTGTTIDDLIEIKISDVDIEKGTILIRSSGERKKVSPELMNELRSYIKSRPGQVYLFEGRCGKPITPKWKRCVLGKLIKMASKSNPRS